MKKQTLKKVLALALATIMSASLLSACGNKAEESKSSEAQSSEVQSSEAQSSEAQSSEAAADDGFEHDPVLNELGVEPFVKEEVTITIGLSQNANIENYDTNLYTQKMEEKSGVNIEFVLFPSGEAQDKLQMMVAGGEKLPDIILWGINDALAQQWGSEEYLVPLEDYFANSSLYAAAGYKRVKESGGVDILQYQTMSDGHIWAFPSYFESTTNPTYNRTWIYGPWLEALNLEAPTTTEEFYEVLKAFKTQDPNGNGKADEIPMVSAQLGGGYGVAWEYMMNAFQHSTYTKNFLVSTDGELSVSYTTDGWKEGVKYITKMVQEGLLDPVSFTQDNNTFKQMLNTAGDQIVGCWSYLSPSFISNDHPSKNEWVLLDPLVGPDGYCSTAYAPDLPANKAYITADCEHPEVAFRLLDLMCSDEMTLMNRWGVEGVNYVFVKDIDDAVLKEYPKYAGNAFDQTFAGHPALFVELKVIWNQPQNTHWANSGPCFRTAEVAGGYYAASINPEVNDANKQMGEHIANYEAAKPAEPISKVTYADPDVQAESDLIAGELKTYVFEKLASWATGKGDVEAEWDAYLAELEAIGLSRFLEIQNEGWN